MTPRVFLSAEWRYLVMLNFAIAPEVLRPLVPEGTEPDDHAGVTFASIVGFRFLRTRVCGLAFPFHRNFEEVNLRFSVRRKVAGEWQRGVVFVSEIVPRRVIAWIARTFYGEPYIARPMRHEIEHTGNEVRVQYGWKDAGVWYSVSARGSGQAQEIEEGSEEMFITEHYWGFTRRGSRTTTYEVEHPRWRVWRAVESHLDCDVAAIYGERFVEALSSPPRSAFIADGSPVTVRQHQPIASPRSARTV